MLALAGQVKTMLAIGTRTVQSSGNCTETAKWNLLAPAASNMMTISASFQCCLGALARESWWQVRQRPQLATNALVALIDDSKKAKASGAGRSRT